MKRKKKIEYQMLGCIDVKGTRVLFADPVNLSQFSVEKYHELSDYSVDQETKANQVLLHDDSGTGCIIEVPQGSCLPVYGKIEKGKLSEIRIVI